MASFQDCLITKRSFQVTDHYLLYNLNNLIIDHTLGVKTFRKMFYRALDSLGDEVRCLQRMLAIEEKTFGVVKGDVEKEFGEWTGTLDQNKKADSLIASALYSSFKTYEKNKKSYEDSFFIFK